MSVELRVALQEERAAQLAERVRRLLGPFGGTEIALDVGCGTGALAFALAPRVAEVVGVDTRRFELAGVPEEERRRVRGPAPAAPYEIEIGWYVARKPGR